MSRIEGIVWVASRAREITGWLNGMLTDRYRELKTERMIDLDYAYLFAFPKDTGSGEADWLCGLPGLAGTECHDSGNRRTDRSGKMSLQPGADILDFR